QVSSRVPRRPPSTLFPYTTLFRSREVIRIDRTEPQSGGSDRLEQSPQERRQRLPPLAPKGAEIDPGEHDLPISIGDRPARALDEDRKSTRLNSSHLGISYAVFCLK